MTLTDGAVLVGALALFGFGMWLMHAFIDELMRAQHGR